jgi:regulator of protease activity HflC (stomatin/prohibitin superfamily)
MRLFTLIATGGGLFVGVILLLMSLTTIDSGQVGVVSTFGKVQDGYLDEGLHFVNPFATVTPFDAREKTQKQEMGIPTQDQLVTTIDISIQYRLIKEMAPKMLKETGSPQQVIAVHMEPLVRSMVREIGKSVERAEMLFQKEVQQRIQAELYDGLASLSAKGVRIDKLLIRKVTLPKIITDAVARKKQMAQAAEAEKEALKKFMVEQERKEAEANASKKAELIQAQKVKEVMLINANAKLEAARIDAEAMLVTATAEAEAKSKVVLVLGQEGYISLEAMKILPQMANGNHVFVMPENGAPLPFLNMTEAMKK